MDSTLSSTRGVRSAREQALFILCVAALVGLGICFIYSACFVSADWPVRNRWWRQLIWLVPGSVGFVVLSRADYRQLRPFFWAGYGLSLVLLGIVLFWGVRIGGARRWFRAFGLLFQPAESARFLTIAAFAAWVTTPRGRLSGPVRAALGLLLAVAPLVLIALEPSLGNALTLVPPLVAIAAVERIPGRVLRPVLVIAAVFAVCYIGGLYRVRSLGLRPRAIAEAASPYWPWSHHVRRVAFFLSDTGDWNDRQSLLAIAGGGAWGKGFKQGIMKMLGYLPRPVAPTDFIFSVV
jgi:rod shape determining protein RodA